jgi:hypothetical protein
MGMFDSIIKRIEKYEEGVRFSKSVLLLIRVKVGISQMDIFSDEGVNVRRAPDFEHLILLQPQALLV